MVAGKLVKWGGIAAKSANNDGKKGEQEWSRELRRTLRCCVYSLERLVSTCVGRLFGISGQLVSRESRWHL
jgi:hypothetical protein